MSNTPALPDLLVIEPAASKDNHPLLPGKTETALNLPQIQPSFKEGAPAGAQRGGTGRKFDWSLVQGLAGKIVLAGGVGPDNVAEAIRQVRPWGIDACSRLESAPGRKDAAKVRALIQAVREAEAE